MDSDNEQEETIEKEKAGTNGLDQTLLDGVSSLSYNGNSVSFRSVEELLRLRRLARGLNPGFKVEGLRYSSGAFKKEKKGES